MTKKWQPYPTYKDSGVEWLGAIPEHWKVKKLKYLAKINLSNVDKKSNENEDTVKLCNYVDVYYNDYITKEIDFLIATASHEQKQKFALKKGDVLLTKDSETWDDIAVPACVANDLDNVICGYHLAHIRPYQDRAIGEYIFRSISSTRLKEQFWVAANGVTRFGISKSSISDALLLEPPVSEQQKIAQFLDQETSKIDNLITKKERLIKLLKEKRTALISHAVTKGLNPDVPMKDSGVEWLGEIPEHWEMVKFSHFIDFQEGPGIMADDFKDEGVPLLRITNLKPGYVDIEGCNYLAIDKVEQKWKHFRLLANDLLISCSASTGLVSIVDQKSANSIAYTGIIRLRPARNNIARDFIRVLVGSDFYFTQINQLKTGTTIQHYGPVHLKQIKIPIPPIPEQQKIAQFLDRETSKIDNLITKTRTSIDHLKEYRTALISAAVTGKIDVREH